MNWKLYQWHVGEWCDKFFERWDEGEHYENGDVVEKRNIWLGPVWLKFIKFSYAK